VTLSWLPPGSGGVTGYRVSRGTTPYNLSFLAAIGNVTGYADTAAATGSFYFYSVTAVNDGAESPPSNITGMVAR
jgi:fibronectin type 3 domain-containing protein